ncbi:MAG: Gfo/Idh/MocA family oxidoreductase [Xanthobacteraceae bacterium]
MKPRVTVIGCGYWGKNLVRNFADLGALASVVDAIPTVADGLAKTFNVKSVSVQEALADTTISGVAIAAPAELHADLARKAFAAGKHVFVEKPISLTVADAESMKLAGEQAGKSLMVGHLLRYHPAFEALLATVQSGKLGALRYAYSHRLSLGKFRVEENALWSFAPHDVSMLLALFGAEPISQSGGGGAFVTKGIDDEYRLDMQFAEGRRAHVFVSWLHPFKEHRLVVVGEKAMAVFEDSAAKSEEKLRLYRHAIDMSGGAPKPKKGEAEPIPYENDEPLKRECRHFLEVCSGRHGPRTDAAEAIRVLRVLTGATPRA